MNYNEYRRKTKKLHVGETAVGGDSPVSVQSMSNIDTRDTDRVIEQTRRLFKAGCQIMRLAVPDAESAESFGRIKKALPHVPLTADIHFDYRLALECVRQGADKIRINPGNIGGEDRVKAVADACRERGIPIRIGVNGGSVSKAILARFGSPTPEALAESAIEHSSLLEKQGFFDILISVKASNVYDTVTANRILAARLGEERPYPLHLGVTEAGTAHMGLVKSACGIGALLCSGIGDTIRVSLTADPLLEVAEGISILKACGVREGGLEVISCPTCGRTRIDLIAMVEEFERRAPLELREDITDKHIKVALMGCAVNGPGEAREADIGIAGGQGDALLFIKGESVRKLTEGDIVGELIKEINAIF